MFTSILCLRPLSSRPLRALLAPTLASLANLLLSSCASVSVKDIQASQNSQAQGKPRGKPQAIVVVPFSLQNAKLTASAFRKGRVPQALGIEARKVLSAKLVTDLSKSLAPTRLADQKRPATTVDTWWVSGRITRVAEGNRLLRMGIGLGAGATKMETRVEVRVGSLSNPPFLAFGTTGGSNATPGAATNPIPYSALPSALMGAAAGVNDDAARTARMITATLADYLSTRGWFPVGKVPKPKFLRQ